MRLLQNLMIILLLTASVPAFAQESTEEADNARAMEILQKLVETGTYSNERQLVDEWLDALSKELGPEHPVLLRALNASGRSFYQQGDHDGALRLFERQVELSKKILGAEDPAALAAMGWLATMLWEMGRLPEARAIEEELVEVRTRILGPEHP
ncbi:MAG: tetratricopeptide repeat protein, partial [bacterium]|nr:tetratricopeptide repeat protein [bacterium]